MSTLGHSVRLLWVSALCFSILIPLAACREESSTGEESSAETPAPAPSPPKRTPNLVIITLDTTRADALGAYGQRLETSPYFDQMAREGVLFEEVMTSSPETLPSHATIFTGKQPFAHGVRGNAGYVLSDHHLTLAEVLKAAGYETRAEIAAVIMQQGSQISQGFSTVRDTSSEGVRLKTVFRKRDGKVKAEVALVRDGADITDSGIDFVRENQHQKFFLWLHYFDAHFPYAAPPPFNEKIPGSAYHAEVAYQDAQMGRFIAELETLGLRDNTLVIVTADHGEGLFEHGEPTHSHFLYNSTVRVPLVLWGLEGLSAGKHIESLVRNIDIAPTALDLLGLYPLYDIDGVSLGPLLRGEVSNLGLTAYGEASRMASTFNISPLRFVRDGRWKYIHKVNPELYDVEADPDELHNQIEGEPEIASRLRGRLEEILRAAPVKRADSVAEVTQLAKAQLRALGYVAVTGGESFASGGESLELFGDDPVTKIEDMDLEARTVGAIVAKRFEAALEWAEPLWERNPDSVLAAALLAESLVALERWQEVVPVLRRSLELDSEDFNARERLVTAFAALARTGEAIAELQFMNRARACHEPTLSMLNQLLHAEGRFEDQRDVVARAAEGCPEVLPNINNYAWILATIPDARLRDGARAIQIIRQAIANLGHRDPMYLDTLAAALAEEGRFDEAIRVQTEVIEASQQTGASGEILREFGDHLDRYRSRSPLRDPTGDLPAPVRGRTREAGC